MVENDPDLPPFLQAVLENADAVLAKAQAAPEALDGLIEVDAAQAEFLPLFDPQSIAAAVLDAHGAVRIASRLFVEEGGARYVDPSLAERALKSGKPVVVPVAVENEAGSESVIFVYAAAAAAFPLWHLPPELAAAAPAGKVVVLTTLAARAEPIERACAAFGLTGLQTRTVQAVVRAGTIKAAAAALGLSHVTARETLSEALLDARRTLPLDVVEERLVSDFPLQFRLSRLSAIQEREADQLGILIAHRAGWPCSAVLGFYSKLASDSRGAALLASHPSGATRLSLAKGMSHLLGD